MTTGMLVVGDPGVSLVPASQRPLDAVASSHAAWGSRFHPPCELRRASPRQPLRRDRTPACPPKPEGGSGIVPDNLVKERDN